MRRGEWQALRDLRLRALAEDETAFGQTLAEALARNDDDWRAYCAGGEDNVTFVAADGERLVGMSRGRASGDEAGLFAMWVAPESRGAGIGRRLVEAVVTWARGRNVSRVVLGVAEDRAPARALYTRCGFKETGRRTAMDRHPELVECEMECVIPRCPEGGSVG